MRYKCCNLLTGGIEFGYNRVALCQRVDHIGGGDIVVQPYDDKSDKDFDFDINKYFEKKKEIINQNKTGVLYHKCVGCVELYERDWPEIENQKIFQMILHHWTKCNSKCIYCYTNKDKEYFNTRKSYQFLPILKQMESKNLLEYGGICSFAGGEISCLPEFESIVKILDKYNWFSIFNSSCVQFEKTVEQHLKKGNGMLIVSTDSGTRELHTKIKQVDTFDAVWKNIKRYAKAASRDGIVYTKYIILKDINDNEEAIDAFIKKSKKAGVKNILMEIDHYYFCANRDNIPEYLVKLFYYAFNRSQEEDIECQIYSNSSVLLLQGQWADEFWKGHVFDAGKEIDKYSIRSVYKYDRDKKLQKFDTVESVVEETAYTYPEVWEFCETNKKVDDNYWFFADEIETNNAPEIKKVKSILFKKKFLFMK